MTAKEVQIGDWLYDRYTKRQVQVSTYTFQYCEEWGDFEPIPLTEEILKKNGFELEVEKEGFFVYKLTCECCVTNIEYLTCDFYTTGIIEIEYHKDTKDSFTHIQSNNSFDGDLHYVHELQRALRCCGLNDLADSFKV